MRSAVLVAVVAVVAGCGSDHRLSHDAYEQRMHANVLELNGDLLRIGGDIQRSSSRRSVTANLRRMAAAIGRTADRADGLAPPKDAEDAHARLVDALRSYQAAVAAIEPVARYATAGEWREYARTLDSGGAATAVRRALAELEAAGYDVGP